MEKLNGLLIKKDVTISRSKFIYLKWNTDIQFQFDSSKSRFFGEKIRFFAVWFSWESILYPQKQGPIFFLLYTGGIYDSTELYQFFPSFFCFDFHVDWLSFNWFIFDSRIDSLQKFNHP